MEDKEEQELSTIADTSPPEKGRWAIETDLILPKAVYFAFYLAYGVINPFFALLWKARGIPIETIGLMNGARPFISFIAASIWPMAADSLGVHKGLLIFLCLVAAFFRESLVWAHTVASTAILLFISEFFGSATGPLLDAAVLQILGPKRKQFYGLQRLWGGVSWGIISFIVGTYVPATADAQFHYIFFAALTIVATGLMLTLPTKTHPPSGPVWASVRIAFETPGVKTFFLVMFFNGCMTGIIINYDLYYANSLGVEQHILGLMMLASAVSEVILFFVSPYIITKLGPENAMIVALLGFVLRSSLYAVAVHPVFLVAAEACHSLTWALMWSSAQVLVNKIAPPRLITTFQGLLNAIFGGLGQGLGTMLGGFVIGRFAQPAFGGRVLFSACAATMVVVVISYYISNKRLKEDPAREAKENRQAEKAQAHPNGNGTN